jgi:hypothetical protein
MIDNLFFQEWVKALREAIEYYNRIQPPDSSTKTSGSVSNTSSPPQEQQSQKPPQEQQSQNTAPPSVFSHSLICSKKHL